MPRPGGPAGGAVGDRALGPPQHEHRPAVPHVAECGSLEGEPRRGLLALAFFGVGVAAHRDTGQIGQPRRVVAPALSSRMNARHTSAPAATMAALRSIPAARPVAQSAGWRSTWPPQVAHSRSAMVSAPCGQAPETSTAPSLQCSRSAAAMTAWSVQVREPVTSTRRGRAGAGAGASPAGGGARLVTAVKAAGSLGLFRVTRRAG